MSSVVSFYRTRQIVLALLALLGFGWFAYQMETAEEPFRAYPAPPFTLKSATGENLSYPGKKGPMVILVVQQQATPEDLALDVKAMKFAQENQASCWLIGKNDVPEQFKDMEFVTRALDPSGLMVKTFPSMSGPVQWVVIDMAGTVRWSGPRNAIELKAKLTDGF